MVSTNNDYDYDLKQSIMFISSFGVVKQKIDLFVVLSFHIFPLTVRTRISSFGKKIYIELEIQQLQNKPTLIQLPSHDSIHYNSVKEARSKNRKCEPIQSLCYGAHYKNNIATYKCNNNSILVFIISAI